MKKPKAILYMILFMAVFIVVTWFTLRPKEPMYDGRPLSVWVEKHFKDEELSKSGIAIRQIGTNGIPFLVDMLATSDTSLKRKLIQGINNKQKLLKIPLRDAAMAREMAWWAMVALGPEGQPAVPALVKLLKNNDPSVRTHALDALAAIGPSASNAIPAIKAPFLTQPGPRASVSAPPMPSKRSFLKQIESEEIDQHALARNTQPVTLFPTI